MTKVSKANELWLTLSDIYPYDAGGALPGTTLQCNFLPLTAQNEAADTSCEELNC